MTYQIEIKEVLSKIVEVKANSIEEAIEIVKKIYKDEKIVLDYSDFVDVKFEEYIFKDKT